MQLADRQESGLGSAGLQLTVLYDNNPWRRDVDVDWGFSCLIRGPEQTILFDTGGNGSMLLGNMRTLGINPSEIDLVVLSHIHGDHVGGLHRFLLENPNVTVFVPKSFPADFKDRIRALNARTVEISAAARICPEVYSTGELGAFLEEQALVVDTNRGLVVVTGCAHPGIVTVVEKAKEMIDKELLLVLGGFHLAGSSRLEIEKIISRLQELGVKHVGPCHCSGDLARALFRAAWGKGFIDAGAGRAITGRDLE